MPRPVACPQDPDLSQLRGVRPPGPPARRRHDAGCVPPAPAGSWPVTWHSCRRFRRGTITSLTMMSAPSRSNRSSPSAPLSVVCTSYPNRRSNALTTARTSAFIDQQDAKRWRMVVVVGVGHGYQGQRTRESMDLQTQDNLPLLGETIRALTLCGGAPTVSQSVTQSDSGRTS